MNSIDIYLPGNPSTRTAQQKGETVIRGRTHHYEKKEVREAKEKLQLFLNDSRTLFKNHNKGEIREFFTDSVKFTL